MNKLAVVLISLVFIGFVACVEEQIVKEFTQDLVKPIFDDHKPAMVLFHKDGDLSLIPVLEEAQPEVDIILSHCTTNEFGNRVMEYFGVTESMFPTLLIIHPLGKEDGMKKYLLDKPIIKENLVEFFNQFNKLELKPYLKSQEIPAEKLHNGIVTLVGKNFQEVVMNNDKDVLVKFYAPWCGHCKKMQPDYEKLAQDLAVNPNIIIAEMDSTGNECEYVTVNSFPTMRYFPGNKKAEKEIIPFNGARDYAGMLEFLKTSTTHPWVEITQELKKEVPTEEPKKEDL